MGILSVSYTHLDVYKRQVCLLLRVGFGLPVFLLPDKLEGGGEWEAAYNKVFGSDTYKAVSYTHLTLDRFYDAGIDWVFSHKTVSIIFCVVSIPLCVFLFYSCLLYTSRTSCS